jgi:hypothetical protein
MAMKRIYRPGKCPHGMATQSLLFDRASWLTPAAKAWLRKHGYRGTTVDAKLNYLRFRQHDPAGFCVARSFRTITFGKGIKAVVCCPRRAQ